MLGFCSVLATFDRHGWVMDLMVHWRILYIAAACVLLLIFILYFNNLMAFLALGIGLFNLIALGMTAPSALPAALSAANGANTGKLRVMFFNLLEPNTRHDQVADYILNLNPDIAIVAEGSKEWHSGLTRLRQAYDFTIENPDQDNYHIMVFSKIKPQKIEWIDMPGAPSFPAIAVRMQWQDKNFVIVGAHTASPMSPRLWETRGNQIESLTEFARKQTVPIIMVGDFNATPWCAPMRDFAAQTGLRRTGLTPLQSTWPWDIPVFGIPIDHIYASRDWMQTASGTGPYLGSDHRPVWADLTFGPVKLHQSVSVLVE